MVIDYDVGLSTLLPVGRYDNPRANAEVQRPERADLSGYVELSKCTFLSVVLYAARWLVEPLHVLCCYFDGLS